jgi:hypothetical protein
MNPRTRQEIYERDGYRCRHCRRGLDDGVTLTIDHVVPRARGGTSDKENLQTLCARCNSRKGSCGCPVQTEHSAKCICPPLVVMSRVERGRISFEEQCRQAQLLRERDNRKLARRLLTRWGAEMSDEDRQRLQVAADLPPVGLVRSKKRKKVTFEEEARLKQLSRSIAAG